MSAKATLELDTASWEAAMRQVRETLRKSGAQVLNRSVGSVLARAIRITPVTPAQRIRDVFYNETIETRGVYKTGKRAGQPRIKKTRNLTPAAFALYRHHTRDTSSRGDDLIARVKRFAARRVASRAFLRYSWIECLAPFIPWTQMRMPRIAGRGPSARPQGIGTPARVSAFKDPEAIVENRAIITNETARPIMVSVLNSAIRAEAKALKEIAERALARAFASRR